MAVCKILWRVIFVCASWMITQMGFLTLQEAMQGSTKPNCWSFYPVQRKAYNRWNLPSFAPTEMAKCCSCITTTFSRKEKGRTRCCQNKRFIILIHWHHIYASIKMKFVLTIIYRLLKGKTEHMELKSDVQFHIYPQEQILDVELTFERKNKAYGIKI